MINNSKFIITILSFIFCLNAVAFGQETTGNIEGTVKDVAGAVVPRNSDGFESHTFGLRDA